jgi:hypothetical protein
MLFHCQLGSWVKLGAGLKFKCWVQISDQKLALNFFYNPRYCRRNTKHNDTATLRHSASILDNTECNILSLLHQVSLCESSYAECRCAEFVTSRLRSQILDQLNTPH